MLEQLKSAPIVPVFYHSDAEYAQQIVLACYSAGLRSFEFTNRGKDAFKVFGELEKFVRAHCPGMLLGIGTIYTVPDAQRFLESGADFIVQPVTTKDVGSVCLNHRKPWIPGALTPNEIWSAWQLGATAVKIFPGNMVGPDYVRALRGPMPDVPIMVTGGVEPTPEDINQWLGAGVQAVGIGSQLFKGAFSDNFPALTEQIAKVLKGLNLSSSRP